MAVKHTPGPWHIEARISVKGLTQRGVKVCYGVNSYGDGPKGTVGDIMGASDANNSIMIASPDLLSALDRLANYVIDTIEAKIGRECVNSDLPDEWHKAIAAIAKAKGE